MSSVRNDLLYHRACACPAGVLNKVEEEIAARGRALVVGPVDKHCAANNNHISTFHSNVIARQANNSFDVVGGNRFVVRSVVASGIVTIARILKNDDVAAHDVALRQERQSVTWSKNEFIDQEMISDGNRILHRSRWYL